jgi:hypothetical protein
MVNTISPAAIPAMRTRFIEAGGKPDAFDHALGELWQLDGAEPENIERIHRAGPRWRGVLDSLKYRLRKERADA